MDIVKAYTRRAPQPPIDRDRVQPGARFVKNRAIHIGKPPIYDVVSHIETVTDSSGVYERVHYVNSETGRKGSMPMRDFCSGAEHRLPDPAPEPIPDSTPVEEPPPDSGVQPATDIDARLARIEARQDEILSLLRAAIDGPLFHKAAR